MKKFVFFLASIVAIFLSSCASSKVTTTISNGYALNQYKYVVYSSENNGDAELDDIIMMVQNLISEKLQVVSADKAKDLVFNNEKVVSPKISVKTEKWDGGHTYISISFYDFNTNQNIAVVKSSGIGLSISQDQELAYKAIKKELNKVFLDTKIE